MNLKPKIINSVPRLSINTITHNRAHLIKEAIDSVISQSFSDWEYIIIDDNSIDNTEDVIKSYNDKRIVYEKVKKQDSISAARNLCLKKSKGKYIAILDSDDIWCDKNKLKEQVDFLDNNINYVVVGTDAIIINNKGEEIHRINFAKKDNDIRNILLGKCQFAHSSVLFRKDIALSLGGYSKDIKTKNVEDYRLYLDMGLHGSLFNIEKYGIKYRETSDQLSKSFTKEQTKQSIYLTKHYRKRYPKFIKSYKRAILRHIIYGKLNLIFLYHTNTKLKKLLFD